MADEKKRIINETTDSALASSGDYVIVDSQTEGTRKFDLGAALVGKVDTVSGKGLSTNDYTTEEKTKLEGIATGATNVTVDNTLSNSGQAADAKKTGDELSQLKQDLKSLEHSLYDESVESGTAFTIDTPFSDAKIIAPSDVKHYGANILEYPYFIGSRTINGITYTVNDDGSIHAIGTATANSSFDLVTDISAGRKPLKAGTYTLSGCPEGGATSTYQVWLSGIGQGTLNDIGSGKTFTISEDKTYYAKITIISGQTVDLMFYPQLQVGSTKTEWEPYTYEVIQASAIEKAINTHLGINTFVTDTSCTVTYFSRVRGIEGEILTLSDFGAVGDGVVDDTDAINDALLASSGKTLFIPEGTYLFSGTLNVKSNTHIFGCGSNSIFKLANTFSLSTYSWRPEDGGLDTYKWGIMLLDENSDGCILENFVIEGQTNAFVDQAEVALVVRGSHHIIKNVITNNINYFPNSFSGRQYNAPGEGIETFNASNIIIENCKCTNSGYEGIGTESSENVTIRNCVVGDANQTGIQIHRSSKNIKIEGCVVDYTDNALAGTALTFHANVGVEMDGIYVENCTLCKGITNIGGGENGIWLKGNLIKDGALTFNGTIYRSDWIIDGNIFRSGGIVARADNAVVVNNMLTVNAGYNMITLRGNKNAVANNVAIGSVSGVYIEPHE